MPEMMVIGSVVLGRGDERIEPPIGKVFDFTADEIKTLLKDSPMPIREPKDESGGMVEVGKPGEPVVPGKVGAEMTSAAKNPGNPLASRQKHTAAARTGSDEDL
jgi:hypothetical protein